MSPDPELLEPAQRHTHALQRAVSNRGLAQHLDVPFVHEAEPVAQITPLLGEPHIERAAGPHRARIWRQKLLILRRFYSGPSRADPPKANTSEACTPAPRPESPMVVPLPRGVPRASWRGRIQASTSPQPSAAIVDCRL